MKRGRAVVGGAIIVAWIIGLAVLVRRELYRPEADRLSEAALRVAPGAVFYGVMQGDRQVGFASSTIDTASATIRVTDYFVADVPMGGEARRASARMNVTLTRGLLMRTFDFDLTTEGAPIRGGGRIEGDTLLVVALASGGEPADTQRVTLSGPILFPTLVPLAVALGEAPKVGKRYLLPLFDPASMAPRSVGVTVRAESTFVVDDSSVFNGATKRWRGVHPDTLHAWELNADIGGGVSGWVDDQGRIVSMHELGFTLQRLPYEVAFENWRTDSTHLAVTSDRDILETTAIAANKKLTGNIRSLRVRLSNADLSGFALNGERQQFDGNVLTVGPQSDSGMHATYDVRSGEKNNPDTKPGPLIQSDNPAIVSLAMRLRGAETDPRIVAERISRWVHDSVTNRITFGVPSAIQVLRSRVGDCNEHTQLFVALARAAGIPARIAAGLAFVDGKFYYHAWPEILLRNWVPVDPTFGQFPADAAHLRFVIGGLSRQAELLQLMGNLKIDVLSVNASGPAGAVVR